MFCMLLCPVCPAVGIVNCTVTEFLPTLSNIDVIVILFIWHLMVTCIEVPFCALVIIVLY